MVTNGLGTLLGTATVPWPEAGVGELKRQFLEEEEVKLVAEDMMACSAGARQRDSEYPVPKNISDPEGLLRMKKP